MRETEIEGGGGGFLAVRRFVVVVERVQAFRQVSGGDEGAAPTRCEARTPCRRTGTDRRGGGLRDRLIGLGVVGGGRQAVVAGPHLVVARSGSAFYGEASTAALEVPGPLCQERRGRREGG